MAEDKIAIVELEDGTRGVAKRLGAHSATIAYNEDGHHYEVVVPNEDFDIVGYVNIAYKEIR